MAAEDWFDGMFTEVLGEIIKKEQENGTSDEMILKILQEKPLAQLYSRTADGASDAFLESMEEIMYEKVFENRALDVEFMAKQEQKWGRVLWQLKPCIYMSLNQWKVMSSFLMKILVVKLALYIMH